MEYLLSYQQTEMPQLSTILASPNVNFLSLSGKQQRGTICHTKNSRRSQPCTGGRGQVVSPRWAIMYAYKVALVVKNLPANAGDRRDTGSIPGSGRSPGEGLFLPGESHGQRSLTSYSTLHRIESDMTEATGTHT